MAFHTTSETLDGQTRGRGGERVCVCVCALDTLPDGEVSVRAAGIQTGEL